MESVASTAKMERSYSIFLNTTFLVLLGTLVFSGCKARQQTSASLSDTGGNLGPSSHLDVQEYSFQHLFVTTYDDLDNFLANPAFPGELDQTLFAGLISESDFGKCRSTRAFESINNALHRFYEAAFVKSQIGGVRTLLSKIPPGYREPHWTQWLKSLKYLQVADRDCGTAMSNARSYLVQNSSYPNTVPAVRHMADRIESSARNRVQQAADKPIFDFLVHFAVKNKVTIDNLIPEKIISAMQKSESNYSTDPQVALRCRSHAPSLELQAHAETEAELKAYLSCLETRKPANNPLKNVRVPSKARDNAAASDYLWNSLAKARKAIETGSGDYK